MGNPQTHPQGQIWDEFAAGLKLGRWRMNLGRGKAELDGLEGSWLLWGVLSPPALREAESRV